MKLINKKTFFTIVASLLFFISCDNLERVPTDQIDRSQSFQSIEDAERWSTGMYATLKTDVYGAFMYSTDIQADQLNASLTFGNRNGNPHRWVEFLADDGLLSTLWGGYYNGLANINAAIAGFQTIDIDPSDQSRLDKVAGDAYLARAYYYHNLVVRFADMYNPATASTDLGVPLLLEFDVNRLPSRNTVQEIYDQILSDIQTAKNLLSNTTGSPGATSFNVDVARALEARVLLYMERYSDARTVAEELINENRYQLITTQADLSNMWTNDFHQEVISSLFTSAPNELANTNSIYVGFIPATGNFAPDFLPSQWVVDMYEPTDYRRDVYFQQVTVEQQAILYPNTWMVNKYPGNPALFTGANTNYQHAPILFRIAEMYLISAEAAFYSSGDPLTRINELRAARNASPLAGLSGTALENAIREERTRELAFEGFRLDDLRRWGLGFTRRDPQNTDIIQTGTTYDSMTQDATANKFTWGIPTRDITINPNIAGQQNPGW